MHSLAGGCLVASGVALAGAAVAATWLPARPRVETERPAGLRVAEPELEDVTAGPAA